MIDGMTRSRKLAAQRRVSLAHALDDDDLTPDMALPEKIPEARDTPEPDVDGTAPRVKVTMSLHRSGTKVYRAQGRGDQDSLNRILVPTAQRTSPGGTRPTRRGAWPGSAALLRTGNGSG